MRDNRPHDIPNTGARAGLLAMLVCSALTAPPSASAGAVVHSFEVKTPRNFGYLIGDTFTHRVLLELADTHRLDERSLPGARRINRWLTLEAPRIEQSDGWRGRHYELMLDYRLVGAPQSVTESATPAMTLEIQGPGDALALAVPAWSFSLGPLVAVETRVEGVAQSLRPPRDPPLIDTGVRWWRTAALAVAAALLLGYLGWLHLHLPWLRAGHGPFDRAARDLRKLAREQPTSDQQRRALARVHRAFDETAGRTLLVADVGDFLREQPRFVALQDPIGAFYACSREVFFVPGGDKTTPGPDIHALHRLCLACRDVERGVA